jgi:hypothetical protein
MDIRQSGIALARVTTYILGLFLNPLRPSLRFIGGNKVAGFGNKNRV